MSTDFDLDTFLDEALYLAGPVGLRELKHALPNKQRLTLEWMRALVTLDDRAFVREAEMAIVDAASVMRFGSLFEDLHAKATAAYHQSERRWARAGHAEDCNGTSLYVEAHARAMRSHGHTPTTEPRPCTCKES